jgi:hypothetical protein
MPLASSSSSSHHQHNCSYLCSHATPLPITIMFAVLIITKHYCTSARYEFSPLVWIPWCGIVFAEVMK